MAEKSVSFESTTSLFEDIDQDTKIVVRQTKTVDGGPSPALIRHRDDNSNERDQDTNDTNDSTSSSSSESDTETIVRKPIKRRKLNSKSPIVIPVDDLPYDAVVPSNDDIPDSDPEDEMSLAFINSEVIPLAPIIPALDETVSNALNVWLTEIYMYLMYMDRWGPGCKTRKRQRNDKSFTKQQLMQPHDDLFWNILRKRFSESHEHSDVKIGFDAKCCLVEKPKTKPRVTPFANDDQAQMINYWLTCVHDAIDWHYNWGPARKRLSNAKKEKLLQSNRVPRIRPNDDLFWDVLRSHFSSSSSRFGPAF